MMRKAVIVPFALGMVIFSGLVLFGGSVADEYFLKNRYFKLKELTEKAALAAANYYMDENEDQNSAEEKTKTLMQNNPLYQEINDIDFIWDTDEELVTAVIYNYNFQTFWLKMFGMNTVPINDINSTAAFISSDEVVSE